MMRIFVATAAVAFAAAAVGCGSQGGPVDERALGLTGHPIIQKREVATRAAAEELLTGRCMERAGFRYARASYNEVLDEQRNADPEPYGYTSWDAVARAVRGHSAAEAPSITKKDVYKASLSKERLAKYQTAYYGPPGPANSVQIRLPDGSTMGQSVGGCHGAAMKRLYGDVAEWSRLEATASYVRIKLVDDTIADPRFKRAAAAWQACAAANGLAGAKTPFAAARKAAHEPAERQGRGIEAIWRCLRKSRVVDTALSVERGKAPSITREYQRDILAYREQSREALRRAERVLGSD